ncbi:MAG: hypothetical protein F4180_07645 [Chloroflexi bacterium]|nr:hypothetical protein [Chloroflexota bacterium]
MATNKRFNIKTILADPDLRRNLMVSTIQAIQAREGINTTNEQADRAYYIVTEVERVTFFELEPFRGAKRGEHDTRHEMFVSTLRGETNRVRHDVAWRDFSVIDGSPLAYERLALISHIFRDTNSLEHSTAVATSGLMTVEVERIMRRHWEIPRSQQSFLAGWSPLAKGGEFSRFYRDIDLLVDLGPKTLPLLEANGCLRNRALYGRPGLTWVPRTQRGFNVQRLPPGAVFGKKGPIILPKLDADTWWLLAILNSYVVEFLLQALMSFGSYEVGVVRKLPIPQPKQDVADRLSSLAMSIHDAKREWDRGNELSTSFERPWVLWTSDAQSFSGALDSVLALDIAAGDHIQTIYKDLNTESYQLYGVSNATRILIERSLGDRPPEVIWPQMEGKSNEQKRMEHVWRLLSYTVKRVVEMDEDGIVPFAPLSGESSLLDRVHDEIATLFPEQDVNLIEVEITNELKRKVKGYKRTSSIGEWLDNIYFDYHASLYKKRPIIWHIASSQGSLCSAFGALCHYHKFDANRMAKLRAGYLRDAIEAFQREAALADKEHRAEDRIEWQAKLEEAQALDRKLQAVQEGYHEGAEGSDRDYRILTPWKSSEDRPQGWVPDIDDGVKVNIEPLQKASVLRIGKVV